MGAQTCQGLQAAVSASTEIVRRSRPDVVISIGPCLDAMVTPCKSPADHVTRLASHSWTATGPSNGQCARQHRTSP